MKKGEPSLSTPGVRKIPVKTKCLLFLARAILPRLSLRTTVFAPRKSAFMRAISLRAVCLSECET